MGLSSKFIIIGDPSQTDLPMKQKSGFKRSNEDIKINRRNRICLS